MKEFFIDIRGYCTIKAESKEEAERIFWNTQQAPSAEAYDEFYEIEGIEEKENNDMENSDLIRRQDAINAARKADCRGLAVESVRKVTDAVEEEIKKLPPAAEPERKHGKWQKFIIRGREHWACSVCGAQDKHPEISNFCYRCGSEMSM